MDSRFPRPVPREKISQGDFVIAELNQCFVQMVLHSNAVYGTEFGHELFGKLPLGKLLRRKKSFSKGGSQQVKRAPLDDRVVIEHQFPDVPVGNGIGLAFEQRFSDVVGYSSLLRFRGDDIRPQVCDSDDVPPICGSYRCRIFSVVQGVDDGGQGWVFRLQLEPRRLHDPVFQGHGVAELLEKQRVEWDAGSQLSLQLVNLIESRREQPL